MGPDHLCGKKSHTGENSCLANGVTIKKYPLPKIKLFDQMEFVFLQIDPVENNPESVGKFQNRLTTRYGLLNFPLLFGLTNPHLFFRIDEQGV